MRGGDIVLVALTGDYGKPRTALVVQADSLTGDDCGSVVVCPLTTHLTGGTSFCVTVGRG
ncbi:MAG: type II toxin-antitoxin system PemK/MazF family toxin [Geminicoccaceae bacterium]